MIVEKIKITKEQEEVLKRYKVYNNGLAAFLSNDGWLEDTFLELKTFTPEQFALLLCGWYEVERTFKVGDWVYDKGLGLYRKITEESFMSDRYVIINAVRNTPDTFEKIEEPWEIMLLELGRDNPNFKTEDIIITNSEVYKADWLTDEEIIELFDKGLVEGFHSFESRIEVTGNVSAK